MTRQGLIDAARRFKDQPIIRQKAMTIDGEGSGEGRFAATGFAQESYGTASDLDGAAVENELPALTERERKDLVEVKVLNRGVRDARDWNAGHAPPVCRDLKIGEIGEAEKVACRRAVKSRPRGTVWKIPMMEWLSGAGLLKSGGISGEANLNLTQIIGEMS